MANRTTMEANLIGESASNGGAFRALNLHKPRGWGNSEESLTIDTFKGLHPIAWAVDGKFYRQVMAGDVYEVNIDD